MYVYKVHKHTFSFLKANKKLEDQMNELAKEGWELVSYSGYVGISIWRKNKSE